MQTKVIEQTADRHLTAQMKNLIQRHLLVFRLALVGLTSLGLYFYSDVFIFIPLMLVPAILGALFIPWREKFKNDSRAQTAIDWYDGVVWIWRGFPAKDDSPHWALKPRMGLGGMSFGMDSDAVDALAVYGPATGLRDSNSLPDDDETDVGLQDSNIEGARAKRAAFAQPDGLTETRAGLILAYDNAGLFEIVADVKAEGLNYDGRHIFRRPPMEVIKHLATSLGEQPIIFENEVVFASNLIFLFEFVTVANDGRSYNEGTSSEKSIIWRSKPRYMGEDLSKYRLMDL